MRNVQTKPVVNLDTLKFGGKDIEPRPKTTSEKDSGGKPLDSFESRVQ